MLTCGYGTGTTPAPADGLSPLDFDLFAILINAEADSIVAPDSTTPVRCRPGSNLDPCRWSGPEPVPEAWTAYIARNQRSFALLPGPLAQRGVRIVIPSSSESSQACGGPAIVSLSRVGFNRDSTDAILHFVVAEGAGPYGGCGFAAGGLLRYQRSPGGAWRRVGGLRQWIG